MVMKCEKREAKSGPPDSVNACEQALLSQENCAPTHQPSQPPNVENNAHNSVPLRLEHAKRFFFSLYVAKATL